MGNFVLIIFWKETMGLKSTEKEIFKKYSDSIHPTPTFSFTGFLIKLKTPDKIINISFVLICIKNTLQKLNKAIIKNTSVSGLAAG